MNIILFDDEHRANFFPLTLTRSVARLRLGILTLAEKWERLTGTLVSILTTEYLQPENPLQITPDNFLINSSFLASLPLWNLIRGLKLSDYLRDPTTNRLLAARLSGEILQNDPDWMNAQQGRETSCTTYKSLFHPEDLITMNREALEEDFLMITAGRTSKLLKAGNQVLGDRLFLEDNVTCNFATINTETGPVYLGQGSLVMEGCHIRGPFAMLEHSTLKMGSKIYGATTLGPHSTLGGEVKNSIITGYSNKAHEGYLGDSVLGEWCNLGADTNNSNLKNTYQEVSLYDYTTRQKRKTKQQFLGIIMGDHSKSGINVTFNTGTVIGVGVNYYGSALSPGFIPDFSWGEASKLTVHDLHKMIETSKRAMSRKSMNLSSGGIEILHTVYNLTLTSRQDLS